MGAHNVVLHHFASCGWGLCRLLLQDASVVRSPLSRGLLHLFDSHPDLRLTRLDCPRLPKVDMGSKMVRRHSCSDGNMHRKLFSSQHVFLHDFLLLRHRTLSSQRMATEIRVCVKFFIGTCTGL